jgi:hypothetical protein
MNKLALVLVVTATLQGCAYNDLVNSRNEFVPNGAQSCIAPKNPSDIKVYRSSMPEEKFEEIGTISMLYSSYDKSLNKMKVSAAENCADALVDIREGAMGVMVSLNATAIKFK